MAADTTLIVVDSAGAFSYLYDLVVAARAADNQIPIPTSAARRLTFIAAAEMRLTTDPNSDAIGIPLEVDIPYIQESGIGPAGEDLRKWFVKGAGNLQVIQEY